MDLHVICLYNHFFDNTESSPLILNKIYIHCISKTNVDLYIHCSFNIVSVKTTRNFNNYFLCTSFMLRHRKLNYKHQKNKNIFKILKQAKIFEKKIIMLVLLPLLFVYCTHSGMIHITRFKYKFLIVR